MRPAWRQPRWNGVSASAPTRPSAHGQACIKGTRIPVAVVLDNLAAGLSAEEIVASYPPLRVDDVRAATAYAAELARERFVEIRHPGVA